MNVKLEVIENYDIATIHSVIGKWRDLFATRIRKGDTVVLKPNWISGSHKYNKREWTSVITHPTIITAVLKLVIEHLGGKGRVIITDAPQTDSSWIDIMSHMEPELWMQMCSDAGVDLQILDLREDEWTVKENVIILRKKLPGDPRGSTLCDLKEASEFYNHVISSMGYYGADYNRLETNKAHSKNHHMYKVSQTVIASDVFINLPKMKTHKKAGITCSLKNLIGINTYKNWLPHYVIGFPDEHGDQYTNSSAKNKMESILLKEYKSFLAKHEKFGKVSIPFLKIGNQFFGDSRKTIRSGNWYGNDTIWRTILDINKILFYANPDGILREENFSTRKNYIAIVDGIIAGDGNGPEAPNSLNAGFLIAGDNPVSVDATCAKMMGFDWQKIPSIKNAFGMKHYAIYNNCYEDIKIISSIPKFNKKLCEISSADIVKFRPHEGWKNHIELK